MTRVCNAFSPTSRSFAGIQIRVLNERFSHEISNETPRYSVWATGACSDGGAAADRPEALPADHLALVQKGTGRRAGDISPEIARPKIVAGGWAALTTLCPEATAEPDSGHFLPLVEKTDALQAR